MGPLMEPATRAGFDARDLVRRVAVEVFGAAAVEVPVAGFDLFTRRGLDEPLAGVKAARLVSDVAAGALREWALVARGAGRGWGEVAGALELDESEDGASAAEVAWLWLVEHRPPPPRGSAGLQAPSAVWTCTTCRGRVRDRGPFDSHPADCEQGHELGCARHAAEVAAWQERTGWGDEDDEDDRGDGDEFEGER